MSFFPGVSPSVTTSQEWFCARLTPSAEDNHILREVSLHVGLDGALVRGQGVLNAGHMTVQNPEPFLRPHSLLSRSVNHVLLFVGTQTQPLFPLIRLT